jgi:PPOX class probable F420-dependent enzyme
MPTQQGNLAFLQDPVAQQLFQSTNMAKLAYVWTDGSPRVVPIWFYWTGAEVWLWSPPTAPKLTALRQNPKVSLTIDRNEWPVKVLLIRGTADLTMGPADAPEYVAMTERYLGAEQSRGWVEQCKGMFPQTARIAVRPEWVGIIDMETRFPSAIERALEG